MKLTIRKLFLLSTVFAIAAAASAPSIGQETAGCTMNKEHMAAMHQHTEEMQSLMSLIEKEKDAEKRKALMHQHMQEMEGSMQKMDHRMMAVSEKCGEMSSSNEATRLSLLEERVDFHQILLDQMFKREIQHESTYMKQGRPQ